MQYEPENTVLGMDLMGEGEREATLASELRGPQVRWGRAGLLLWLLLGVMAAEGCLMYYEPGAGLGAFGLILLGILLLSREWTALSRWQIGGLVLFGLSALQSVIFTSMSNVLVMGSLLLLLSGERAHGSELAPWRSWVEGMLSGVRPFAALGRGFQILATRNSERQDKGDRIAYMLSIAIPVAGLLVVFGLLLSGGNAILGNWLGNILDAVERFLYYLELPTLDRWIFWGFFGLMTLMLVCVGGATRLTAALAGTWPHLGSKSGKLRLHQWYAALIALNLLFLLSSITDVVFLWFSRELPEGVTHSRYLHTGVYALILTTLLSAFILGTLTQHTDRVRKNRVILGLSSAWMIQNIILISGVFLRLWIYIDAYGYTPKRIYVSLFLCLVLAGYASLAWAITRYRDFKWLVSVNLVLVFGYFSLIQFVDVRRIVVNLNVPLYRAGEIDFPESLHLRQIGSHQVPYLIEIIGNPQSVVDHDLAMGILTSNPRIGPTTGWQSFQSVNYKNRLLLEEFLSEMKE